MEQLLESCDEAASFPLNLIHHDTYEHNLRAYVERLDKQEPDLFHKKENARLDLVDFDSQTWRSLSKPKFSLWELEDYMHKDLDFDLHRRFVFLTAPNSRDRLYVSRQLLTYILSYHQVMPSFLDFLFLFGRQEHARDLSFSGFHQESRLEPWYNCLGIPELGRSGRELRMCYNLKSVEPSKYQPHMPWSIRQTAVYHSQDLVTGKAFWIIVKGDELIKKRIQDSMNPSKISKQVEKQHSKDNTFSTSLATHMVILDWCNENWRWYISYLEEMLRNKTGLSFAVRLDNPQSPDIINSQKLATASTLLYPSSEARGNSNSSFKTSTPSLKKSPTRLSGPLPGPPPPSGPPLGFNTRSSSQSPPESLTEYSFTDFQAVQLIGDRVNEVLLVLESNISILTKIEEYYHTVSQSEYCPKELKVDGRFHLEKFEKRTSGIISDLRIEQSRGTTLLRQVTDRKDSMSELLKAQNLRASNILALKARESQENMELITKDMHTLALKTKSETVSMRIITLVAMFFLPGTFISTIMSTDIVRFQRDDDGQTQKLFELDALQLFLAICLPMMAVVFVAWYGVYWWANQEERPRRRSDISEQV